MAAHRLEREQLINASLKEVWQFFSNPANLKKITPEYMNFTVTSGETANEIYTGQIISYKVSPLLGIPLNWETEITAVTPLQYFIDNQNKGPYKLWRHSHFFEEKDGKVLMTDVVEYELPLGILGSIAHAIFVKKQLEGIFNFRVKTVERLFN